MEIQRISTMGCCSAPQNNDIMSFDGQGMEPGKITLSEVTQTQTDMACSLPADSPSPRASGVSPQPQLPQNRKVEETIARLGSTGRNREGNSGVQLI